MSRWSRMPVVLCALALAACGGKGKDMADSVGEIAVPEDSAGPTDLSTSREPEFPLPKGQVEVLFTPGPLPMSFSAHEVRFALVWMSEEVLPLTSPSAGYKEGEPASLVVDMAKHFSALEGSDIGKIGFGIGLLVAFRDGATPGSFDLEQDPIIGLVQSHVFVYIGSKPACFWEEKPYFAPYNNFACVPGVYVAEVQHVSVCSEDEGCLCEDHDGAKKLNSQPATLDVQVNLSEELPCSDALNFF